MSVMPAPPATINPTFVKPAPAAPAPAQFTPNYSVGQTSGNLVFDNKGVAYMIDPKTNQYIPVNPATGQPLAAAVA